MHPDRLPSKCKSVSSVIISLHHHSVYRHSDKVVVGEVNVKDFEVWQHLRINLIWRDVKFMQVSWSSWYRGDRHLILFTETQR